MTGYIICHQCKKKIPTDIPPKISGKALVRGSYETSIKSFREEGVEWDAYSSWKETVECPHCHKETSLWVEEGNVERDCMAKDIMENYPEYSSSYLLCDKWDYDNGIFRFYDTEEDKRYTVTLSDVAAALPKFERLVLEGRLKFYELELGDVGSYDAFVTDAIVQIAIFGEVIYS